MPSRASRVTPDPQILDASRHSLADPLTIEPIKAAGRPGNAELGPGEPLLR